MANVVLLAIMSGALYTLYILKDPFERMVPSLIFGLLLVCRLVILYQVNRREAQQLKALLARQQQQQKEVNSEEDKKAN